MKSQQFYKTNKVQGNDPLSLEDLMYKYGTDKSKDDHKYSDLYAMLFDPIREKVSNVLEIGVSTGQSLKVWHDYFPEADIYGIDIFGAMEEERVQAELNQFKRVQIFRANSQQKEDVDALGLTPNTMDIVIDDGDHTFVGQERTLHVMWPFVQPGGYYMIEDVEWDREGDPKLYPILHAPHLYFQPHTIEILENNDAFFADTALGHRSWNQWQKKATSDWVVDRFTHNSHVVVIRKRVVPLRPVSINYGDRAMTLGSANKTGHVLDIQQALDLAVQNHTAGRLPEAESLYQQILQADPNQPVALHLLGVIAHQAGKNDIAVDLIEKSLAVNPNFAEAYNNLGLALHDLGKLDESVTSYRKALTIKPDYSKAHNNLGLALQGLGESDEAIANYYKAINIAPDNAKAHINLGNAFQDMGKLDEAVASYQKALDINPDFAEAHSNLGNALLGIGQVNEAVVSHQKALAINPDDAEAHINLGNAHKELGRLEDAIANYKRAIAIKPKFAEAYINLGLALQGQGQLEDAVSTFENAIAIKPNYSDAHFNLGNVFNGLGMLDEAVASYQKALAIKPDNAEARNNLSTAFQKMGKLDEAVANYQEALAINPDFAEVYCNLGNVFNGLGKLDEAVASYQKALAINPDYILAHSGLLLTEQYCLGHSAETLFKLHCEWDERHGQAFRSNWPAHKNTPEAERRLRIGFVSPDLGRHPVGYFSVLMFENLPGLEFETVCYSERIGDDLTERIRDATGAWRETSGVSDEDLWQSIMNDGIDILIDLSGHSGGNRLLVFARKPAPLQVTWAGYVGTTGLSAIDYLVSDRCSTLENEEPYCSEKVIRMPDGYVCYDPPDYAPDVGPLPRKRTDGITFCSFNNPAKINEDVVSVWARILDRVAGARLLIKYKGIDSTANMDRLSAMFDAKGVDPSRLILEGQSPHGELLARYNDVDIALDPFPYSGGLTTYEALWMGVPVITVPGETFASRHSQIHLSTAGLPELVARDRDDYVRLAVGLANDIDRLAGLRTELRGKVSSSPICDGEKFAKAFATLMRDIWRKWCLSRGDDCQ